MAYYTGSAADISELHDALNDNLVTEGYSVTSDIYSKGTLFVKLTIPTTGPTPYNRIEIKGGTGRSGSTLTGGLPDTGTTFNSQVVDGTFSLGAIGASGLQYPATWHLHILDNPDEVYFFVLESGNRWSWLAFGQSPADGIPGTGNWYAASIPNRANSAANTSMNVSASFTSRSSGLFHLFGTGGTYSNQEQGFNSSIHHGLDGNSWSQSGSDVGSSGSTHPSTLWSATASIAATSLITAPLWLAQPNQWNSEAILMRIQPHVYRGSGKSSMVGNIEHSRYIRNDNYDDGDIITLGADSWKVYPFVKKNASDKNAISTQTHSGTYALAVRYDP